MDLSTTDEGDQEKSRQQRKMEGKRLKQEKIETSGGKRPRTNPTPSMAPKNKSATTGAPSHARSGPKNQVQRRTKPDDKVHRFGRVMDQAPCPGKPRTSTLSIAVPGSIVSNAQTRELKTYLVSQIARAATIYHVDEIVVYDDKLSVEKRHNHLRHRTHSRDRPLNADDKEQRPTEHAERQEHPSQPKPSATDPHVFMARVLQYCECPQYLRRNFFPMHADLQFAGLLPPIDAPHHVRADDRSKFREGVVLDKCASSGNSLVNCGIRNRPVE